MTLSETYKKRISILAGIKTINEESDFSVKKYAVKVKHDKGTKTIKTSASSEEAAKSNICKSEGCPESAIISTKEIN